jgi:peptide/nickel transport system permease protein
MFFWRFRQNRKAMIGAIIVLALLLTIVFAPFIAPMDPLDGTLSDSLHGPSSHYLLGTDKNGRDVFSRLI